jgi:carbonic anhydrase
MDTYKNLLAGNKRWAEEKLSTDPDFFERLSRTWE